MVMPGRMCQRRWQVDVVTVAPVSKVGKQIRDDQKRVLVIADLVSYQSRSLAIRQQGHLRPRRTFVVGCAIVGSIVIGYWSVIAQSALDFSTEMYSFREK